MTESDVKTAVLHRKLAEHLDTETADALIERLPPDWEQIATKTDVARLEIRMDALGSTLATAVESFVAKLESMEGRLNRRAASDLKALMFAFAGFALAVVGGFVTVLVSGVPAAG